MFSLSAASASVQTVTTASPASAAHPIYSLQVISEEKLDLYQDIFDKDRVILVVPI